MVGCAVSIFHKINVEVFRLLSVVVICCPKQLDWWYIMHQAVEFGNVKMFPNSKIYKDRFVSMKCGKAPLSRSAWTALIRHDKSIPLASRRSIMSPRRIEHILLCSWPETHESNEIPFVKRAVLWLGGIALHHELIAADPKILISHLIKCFIMP